MEEKVETSYFERGKDFVKNNYIFVGVIGIGVILVVIGLFQYFSSKSDGVEFVTASKDVNGVSMTAQNISVDVEGYVQKPGVYSMADTSRIQDALIAAGGMSSEADREYVSKHLNLAQKVTDGGKIYIPGIGESPAEISAGVDLNSNLTDTGTIGDNTGLLNINTATSDQLDALPKIGPVTAQKIISGRPYATIDELVSKKVLTQKTYDGLKDRITAE